MANREKIAPGEYYHIYNRGVDKRPITKDSKDIERFIQSLEFFNSKEPTISLREVVSNENIKLKDPLIKIICYCLNPNHYHFLLKEIHEGGISEFMKRLNGGYTWYFNNKHKRSGSLFQGAFKSVHVKSNEQLLHISAYVNLNDKVHEISGFTAGKVRSSWDEYMGKKNHSICSKDIILGQFKSTKEYKSFAESSLKQILRLKKDKNSPLMIIGKHLF
mgnify:CR=1 FL=1